MGKLIRRSILLFVAIAVIFVASCSYQSHQRTTALEAISLGETEQSVLQRLGEPSNREFRNRPYTRYASLGCISPCATRLWWEWPLFRGIEAWSVELDSSGKVVGTTHWVSP